jgi:hypothetical protein
MKERESKIEMNKGRKIKREGKEGRMLDERVNDIINTYHPIKM